MSVDILNDVALLMNISMSSDLFWNILPQNLGSSLRNDARKTVRHWWIHTQSFVQASQHVGELVDTDKVDFFLAAES